MSSQVPQTFRTRVPFHYTDGFLDELVERVSPNSVGQDHASLRRDHGRGLAKTLASAVLQGSIIVYKGYRTASYRSRGLYPARLLVEFGILTEELVETDANKIPLDLAEEGRSLYRRHFPLPTEAHGV